MWRKLNLSRSKTNLIQLDKNKVSDFLMETLDVISKPEKYFVLIIDNLHLDAPPPSELTDQVIEVSEIAISQGYTQIYFIGGAFRQVQIVDLPNEAVIIPTSASWIFSAPALQHDRSYIISNSRSPYSSLVAHLKTTDAPTTFIAMSKDVASTPYDLAALVKTSRLGSIREWGTLGMTTLSTYPITNAFKIHRYQIPNIFSGDDEGLVAKVRNMEGLEYAYFRNFIVQGIDCLRAYLDAGYHLLRNISPIPSYAASMNSSWPCLALCMFEVYPGMIDQNHQRAFVESSQFRRMLTRISLYVLGNLVELVIKLDRDINSVDSRTEFATKELAKWGDVATDAMSIWGPGNVKEMMAWTSPDLWKRIRDFIALT